MAGDIFLTDGHLAVTVRPAFGAGIARFDCIGRGSVVPLFRPEPAEGGRDAFELACQVLVPWSNRISSSGFTFRGKRYYLEPNVAGEPFPIHGNGFSLPWDVIQADVHTATLRIHSKGPGPYRYEATLTYRVRHGALTLNLAVRNTGAEALPFGFGFHPWIVRTQMTELQAPAYGVWLEDERHLPLGPAAAPIPAKWNFSSPVPLPPGFINNAFVGWDGAALVRWPDRHLQMAIRSSPALSTYILYSPSEASDFFCFEPVSHPVDAFNLTDPGSAGVVILAQGETADASTEFKVSALS